jgi:heme-degrading monooxygenase HmoA
MKKTLIIVLIIILGSVGFLAYDWQVKTTLREDDQRVTLYSWTDENGARHYTNAQPPDGARNIEERKGYKYTDQPLVVKIKDKTINGYKRIKAKLFKKKDRKKKKQ